MRVTSTTDPEFTRVFEMLKHAVSDTGRIDKKWVWTIIDREDFHADVETYDALFALLEQFSGEITDQVLRLCVKRGRNSHFKLSEILP